MMTCVLSTCFWARVRIYLEACLSPRPSSRGIQGHRNLGNKNVNAKLKAESPRYGSPVHLFETIARHHSGD